MTRLITIYEIIYNIESLLIIELNLYIIKR